MGTSMLIKVTCLAMMICMVLEIPLANASLSCGQIQLTLIPCLSYVKNPTPTVPEPCCGAVRTINNEAQTPPERRDACQCLKDLIKTTPDINIPAVAGIPDKCGVPLPYKIGPDIDCSKVN